MRGEVNVNSKRNQSGVAMIIVLFSLLLLSVVGLGMMYSTNMETSINSNYRDKQTALYAALAGLQEGRDRIKYPYNITPPFELPSTTIANVIYIVADAATVKPWAADNKYFDTELCQEKVLGISPGTPGVPCTATASGTAWRQVFDDSLGGSAPWNLASTDLKWVRIQLKANNNTPVPVNGDSASSAQACWNGSTQMSTPTGGGGVGASAIATLSSSGVTTTTGYVSSVTVTAGGSSYTSAPTVNLSGGGGSGATATTTLGTSGNVTTVNVTSPGTQCYSAASDAVVSFTGGGGSGATATAVLEGSRSCIYSLSVTNIPQCTNKLTVANGYSPADQKAGVTFEVAGQNKSFSGTLFVS